MISRNTWVMITRTLLEPAERTGKLPEETKQTPFKMFVKGYLQQDAEIGDEVEVKTRTGRTEQGILMEANPQYEVNYGDFVSELLVIGDDARALLFGGVEA